MLTACSKLPFGFNNAGSYNFQIIEQTVGGIASVQFTGITSVGYTDLIIDEGDINENQLPRGGIIVSLASTPGRGYAPFAGARVKLEIGAGNSITGVVGVPTTGISYDIVDAQYDNKTGILTVSTLKSHGLRLEDQMKLDRLKFTCPKQNVGTPSNVTYTPSTGIATITFPSAHGLVNGDAISIDTDSLTFTCTQGPGTHTYPRATDPAAGQYLTISNVTTNTLRVNVGTGGTGTSPHTFVSATTNAIKTLNYQGVTTSFFPDYEDSLPVTGIISARTFKTLVGPSTIPHTYESGGTVAQYYALSFGSGYQTGLGTIGIAITDYEYAHTFSSRLVSIQLLIIPQPRILPLLQVMRPLLVI